MLVSDVNRRLEPRLRLQRRFAHVQAYLHGHDPDLRLRVSAERPEMWVLERRCRRAPAVNTGMRAYTDIHVQARDGYIHISLVHREWLMHPQNIIQALREEGIDLWAQDASKVVDELEYEERFVRESRRRRVRAEYRDQLRETFDILSRRGNADGTERSRFSNPGLPAGVGRQNGGSSDSSAPA